MKRSKDLLTEASLALLERKKHLVHVRSVGHNTNVCRAKRRRLRTGVAEAGQV